jgi:hypothetical protein
MIKMADQEEQFVADGRLLRAGCSEEGAVLIGCFGI